MIHDTVAIHIYHSDKKTNEVIRLQCRGQESIAIMKRINEFKQVALSLLKVITQMHLDGGLSEEQMKSAQRAAKLLCTEELSATQNESETKEEEEK